MEHYVIYSLASGLVIERGRVPAGEAAIQQLPEGSAIVVVPWSVVAQSDLDLGALRTAVAGDVDAAAEMLRLRFLTPGAGQALTYIRKENEARAWTADNSKATPFIDAEGPFRGMSRADLAAEIIMLADAWVTVGSAIEAVRLGAKAAVAAADTFGAIIAAGRPTWPTFQ